MSRLPRKRSQSGIYHVMLRGAGRQTIFFDNEDYSFFLRSLGRTKELSDFKLYAYCLMGNHVHLLIKETKEPIDQIMKRLGVRYVSYYNKKYESTGHLFQDRYRSETVETDSYFLDVIRYICQNPVKSGLTDKISDYPWVSCSVINPKDHLIADIREYTDMTNDEMLRFIMQPCEQDHIEITDKHRLTDTDAIKYLTKICNTPNIQSIRIWESISKNKVIISGYKAGISIRQLSRLIGINKSAIERIIKEN